MTTDAERLATIRVPIGYAVLTEQPDGSWQPDWDGLMHVERAAGIVELALACHALGPDSAQLVILHVVPEDMWRQWADEHATLTEAPQKGST